eukprot:scaffold55084_cov73-Phaeocystis_antarctica.AAC.1
MSACVSICCCSVYWEQHAAEHSDTSTGPSGFPAYVTSVGRRLNPIDWPTALSCRRGGAEQVPLGERPLVDRHRVVLDGRQAAGAACRTSKGTLSCTV